MRLEYFFLIDKIAEIDLVNFLPIPLRAPLPAVSIPLRPADAEVLLELQPIFELAYANGGYDDTDYAADTDPPLTGDDAAWADGLLRAARRRG